MHKEKNIKHRLNSCLKTLHLSTIRNCYADITGKAKQESLGYEDYLLELLEEECGARYNNRIKRLIKSSKLPLEKNIDCFDLKRLPHKAVQQIRTLLEGSFLEHKENVLAFGNPGSGNYAKYLLM